MQFSFVTTPTSIGMARQLGSIEVAERVLRPTRKVMKEEADAQIRILKRLVSTWDEHVEFHYRMYSHSTDNVEIRVWTDNRIFAYVDQGTSIRFATMTKGFIPKTQEYSLTSGRGNGGLAYVNTNKPRAGIASRRFMHTLYDKRRSIFNNKVQSIITKEISAYWHEMWGH